MSSIFREQVLYEKTNKHIEQGIERWSAFFMSRLQLFGKVDFIFQKIVQGPKKSENKRKWKRSIFVIDSYLKDSAFKAVKRDAKF